MTALFFDDIMAFHEMMYQQRSAETAKRIRKMRSLSARKNGTALVIGAIPPNLKLLPSNRKPFRLRGFTYLANTLCDHCSCHFLKACNICSDHIVTLMAIFLCSGIHVMEDIYHNTL